MRDFKDMHSQYFQAEGIYEKALRQFVNIAAGKPADG